ncbi:MAG: GNAT family N-acetyltransferase [Solobacterium sp.]|nr:GNAT family N-acetyltransferase [Solobacterium sp.]
MYFTEAAMHTIQSERITPEEYISFLKRTDLGSQYPRERFEERIEKLLTNAAISLTARDGSGLLIGVLLGITDFAYWLFVTDLGVDRNCARQGIGTELMKAALEEAGGEKDIIVYLTANSDAVTFYKKLGMVQADDVMVLNHADWTSFTVK